MKCILCGDNTDKFQIWRESQYYRCNTCRGIMLDSRDYLDSSEEKSRYKEHNNDVEDERYQGFVSPIVEGVFRDYNKNHKGLDFGAGTGPVITKLLRDEDYNIKIYDPYFANNPELLEEKYDYIVCCEVIEHFYNPKEEFRLLKSLLKTGGSLYIMTSIYNDEIEFESWGYKDDPTHVFFYENKTVEWIKKEYKFSELIRDNKLTLFRL